LGVQLEVPLHEYDGMHGLVAGQLTVVPAQVPEPLQTSL
jgi:hypothetical protein